MLNKIKQFGIVAALALLSANVMALPITGQLEMTGAFYALDAEGERTSDASTAVAIDFSLFGGYDKFRVTASDGSFAGLTGRVGDITDFQFDGFSSPIANFWSIDIFSFELTGIERRTSRDPVNNLLLSGEGILIAIGNGYDDNIATNWTFSGDTSGNGLFSWSASSTNAVPEPGMLALLSLGLIGLGLRRKI